MMENDGATKREKARKILLEQFLAGKHKESGFRDVVIAENRELMPELEEEFLKLEKILLRDLLDELFSIFTFAKLLELLQNFWINVKFIENRILVVSFLFLILNNLILLLLLILHFWLLDYKLLQKGLFLCLCIHIFINMALKLTSLLLNQIAL